MSASPVPRGTVVLPNFLSFTWTFNIRLPIALISSIQIPVIAATSLTLPTNYKSDNIKIAQSISILGDIIRTNRETDAKRICYDRATKKGYSTVTV